MTQLTDQERRCTRCHEPAKPNARFCAVCGTVIAPAEQPAGAWAPPSAPTWAPPAGAVPPSAPPTWGAPSGPPPWAPALRPLRGLATALTVLFSVEALALVGYAAARFQEADLLHQIQRSPFEVSAQRVADNTDLVNSTGGFSLLVGLAAFIVLIVWLYRATVNARALGQTRWSPGWAVGAWFIPLANAVIPWQVIHQADRAGRRSADEPTAARFGWWIALASVGALVTIIARNVYDDVSADVFPDVARAAHAATGIAIGSLVLAAAAVLAIVNVRRISERQHQR